MRQLLLVLLILPTLAWSHGNNLSHSCNGSKFNYIQLHQVKANDVHFAKLKHFYFDEFNNITVCAKDSTHKNDYPTGQCRYRCSALFSSNDDNSFLSPQHFGLPDDIQLTNIYFSPICGGVFATVRPHQ